MQQSKKFIFFLMFLTTTSYIVRSQNLNKPFKVFIKEYGLKSISKEEFLKLDSVTVEPKNYYYFTFTIIVADGKGWYQYVMTKGTKIDSKVKEWVLERDSCIISLDEINVYAKDNKRWAIPPVVISVK